MSGGTSFITSEAKGPSRKRDGRPVALSPASLGREGHPFCAHHLLTCVVDNKQDPGTMGTYIISGRPRVVPELTCNCFCGTLFGNQYVWCGKYLENR